MPEPRPSAPPADLEEALPTDELTPRPILRHPFAAESAGTQRAERTPLAGERAAVLEEVFRSAPSFLHVLRGPEFIFEFANEAYYQLVGRRDLIGRPAFEAMPEAAAGGYPERIARVMTTGESFFGRELPVMLARTPGAPPEERLIDLVYLPLLDADGTCSRVLGHGTDVTEQVRARREAEAALRESEVRRAEAAELRESEARRAAAALQESEARFRLMADAVPQIVWITDAEGRVEFFNRQWTLYTGVPYQPTTSAQVAADHVHPDDPEATVQAFNRARQEGSPFLVEHRIRSAEGTYRWFLVRAEPHWDPQTGEIIHWFGASVDIHDRKMAEAALRATEHRQAFLIRLADTLRSLLDPLEVQGEASRVLGEQLGANRVAYFEVQGDTYTVEREYLRGVPTILGRHPITSFGPELFGHYQQGLTAAEADVEANAAHSAAERSGFQSIQTRAYVGVPLIKAGVFVAGLAVHSAEPREWTPEEITLVEETAERTWAALERARSEQALRASEERFRTLFVTMDEGFCVVEMLFNPEGKAIDYRILEMNPAFEKHTGLQGVVGRTVREFAPDLDEFWFETYGHVATTGEPIRFARQAETLESRWFDVYAFRLGAAPERKVAILFNDITEQKRAADALKEEARRKDEFLATLAHELRNPLAPIVTATEVLRLRAEDPDAVERARETVRRQVDHMRHLIDDLLDVARITRGMVELHLETVDLGGVLTGAAQMARPLTDRRGQELSVVLPRECVGLRGDPHRLTQVVANLLTNAAKFTPFGGRISVTTQCQGTEVLIRVRDTGKGIPPEMLPYIFDLFTQVNPSIDRAEGGLGIGLTLVQKLVEMHGGTVEAHSAGPGLGSEFVVRLPFYPALLPAEGSTNPAPHPAGQHSLRVLAVDDNLDAADTLAELLPLWGHEVSVAYTGPEALRLAREYRPNVVLLDLGLPGMDGYTVAQRIREDLALATVRLVALTGFGQEEDRQRTREVGFDEHLTKPVDPDELRRVLDAQTLH